MAYLRKYLQSEGSFLAQATTIPNLFGQPHLRDRASNFATWEFWQKEWDNSRKTPCDRNRRHIVTHGAWLYEKQHPTLAGSSFEFRRHQGCPLLTSLRGTPVVQHCHLLDT